VGLFVLISSLIPTIASPRNVLSEFLLPPPDEEEEGGL
jgi:hypothetical protein